MHEFDAVLKRLEGKIAWTVFYVPFSVQEVYNTKGRVKVKARIDGHAFAGTLLPSRNGHYMAFNREMKAACKKGIEDSVHVTLELDTEPRVVEVPADVLVALETNGDAYSKFQALPYYIKREEIRKITGAKKQETRERRLQKLIDNLQQAR
jgi:uncharacterized protein DUF1905/bacteriocin resistance YdeI/OmpD-like protein